MGRSPACPVKLWLHVFGLFLNALSFDTDTEKVDLALGEVILQFAHLGPPPVPDLLPDFRADLGPPIRVVYALGTGWVGLATGESVTGKQ